MNMNSIGYYVLFYRCWLCMFLLVSFRSFSRWLSIFKLFFFRLNYQHQLFYFMRLCVCQHYYKITKEKLKTSIFLLKRNSLKLAYIYVWYVGICCAMLTSKWGAFCSFALWKKSMHRIDDERRVLINGNIKAKFYLIWTIIYKLWNCLRGQAYAHTHTHKRYARENCIHVRLHLGNAHAIQTQPLQIEWIISCIWLIVVP